MLRNFPRQSVWGGTNEGLDEFLGTYEEISRLKRTEKSECGQLLLWVHCASLYNRDVSKYFVSYDIEVPKGVYEVRITADLSWVL